MCPPEERRWATLSALRSLVITVCLTSSVVIAQDHCIGVCESIRGELSSTDACAKARKILPRPKIGRVCQEAYIEAFELTCLESCELQGTDRAIPNRLGKSCNKRKRDVPKPAVHKACVEGFKAGLADTSALLMKLIAERGEEKPLGYGIVYGKSKEVNIEVSRTVEKIELERGKAKAGNETQEGRAVDVQSAQPTLEGTTRASDDDVLGKIGAEEDDVDTPPKNELFPMSEEEGKSRDESTIEVVTRSLSRDHAGREGDTFIVDDDVDLGDLHVATEISVNGERDNVDKRYEYGSKSVDDLDGDVSDVTGTLARAKAGVDENGDSNDTEGQEYPGNGDNRVTESIEAEEFTEEATELAQWGERRGEDTSRAMDPNGAGLDNQSNKENAPLGADGFDSNSDSANDVQRTTGDKHQDRGQKLLAATEEDTRENSGTGARDAGILVTDAVKEEGNYESTAVNKTIPVDQEKGTGAARVDASHQSDRGNKMREAGRQQQQREEEEEERQDAGTLPIAVLDWTSTDSYETNSPSLAIGEHSAGNSDSPLGSPHAPPDVVEKDGVNTTQDTMRSVAAETINNSKSVREVPWATDSCALREGVQVMTEELACH